MLRDGGTCVCFASSVPLISRSAFHGRSQLSVRVSFRSCPYPRCAPRISPNSGGAGNTKALIGGGGFLGVGPQEVLVVLAVGWILLGPKQLFQLARDAGKLIGELRRTADEARTTFTDALEADLATEEAAEIDAVETEGNFPETTPATVMTASAVEEQDAAAATAQANFRDQLRRVSDPNQRAPSEVRGTESPDIIESEKEIARLEMELLEARKRLAENRKAMMVDGVNVAPAANMPAAADVAAVADAADATSVAAVSSNGTPTLTEAEEEQELRKEANS